MFFPILFISVLLFLYRVDVHLLQCLYIYKYVFMFISILSTDKHNILVECIVLSRLFSFICLFLYTYIVPIQEKIFFSVVVLGYYYYHSRKPSKDLEILCHSLPRELCMKHCVSLYFLNRHCVWYFGWFFFFRVIRIALWTDRDYITCFPSLLISISSSRTALCIWQEFKKSRHCL